MPIEMRTEARIRSPHLDALKPPEIEPKRIARTINVAAIPLSMFRAGLAVDKEAGRSVTKRSWIEAQLIQKSDGSLVSAKLVMAVGGNAGEKETFSQAMAREAAEETVSTDVAINETMERWQGQNDHRFQFMLMKGKYPNPRVVDMRVLEVESDSFSLNNPRESDTGPHSEDKIGRIIRFRPDELQTFINEGKVTQGAETFLAASHMTIAEVEHDEIGITPANKNEREQLLNNVMTEVNDFDRRIKTNTLQEINRVRRITGLDPVFDLDDCEVPEISRGFVAAQMRMALADEAAVERPDKPAAKDSLLKVLPYLVSELPPEELPNLLLSLPNRETIQATRKIQDGLQKGLEVVAAALPNPREVDKANDPLRVMQELWPRFLELPPSDRKRIIRNANEAVVSGLAESTGVTPYDVMTAKDAADEFHDFVKSDLKSLGDMELFQELNPSNEIINASIFTLLTYSVGLHPYREQPAEETIEDRVRRFEALRHLSLIMIGTEVAQEIRTADNSLFEGALDAMTKPRVRKPVNVGGGKILNVFDRETNEDVIGMALHLQVDERLKKRVTSGIRKRIQDPEMRDIFSTNVILDQDNFPIPDQENDSLSASADYLEMHLDTAAAYRKAYIDHTLAFAGGAEAGWKISIVEGTERTAGIDNARDVIRKLRESKEGEVGGVKEEIVFTPKEFGGKRTGSSADKFIRDKFVLHLEGPNGEEEFLEKSIYPFASTNSKNNPFMKPLEKAGLFGWREKIEDDSNGPYKTERIRGRSPKYPTKHSLFGLLYPGHLYEKLAERIKEVQIKTLKSRNGETPDPATAESVYSPS